MNIGNVSMRHLPDQGAEKDPRPPKGLQNSEKNISHAESSFRWTLNMHVYQFGKNGRHGKHQNNITCIDEPKYRKNNQDYQRP